MDSILSSVKIMLGLREEQTAFDNDIIICINTALNILIQLGVGPKEGFTISDSSSVWSDFIGEYKDLEMVKLYTAMKVRLMWDPPTSSYLIENIKTQINEFEWRIVNAHELD